MIREMKLGKELQVEKIYSILRYRVGVMFRYQKFLRRREKIVVARSHERLKCLELLVSEVLDYVVNVKIFPVNKFFFQVVWEFFLLHILALMFFRETHTDTGRRRKPAH